MTKATKKLSGAYGRETCRELASNHITPDTKGSTKKMINAMKRKMGRDEEQGFTLIELMVVVLIIGILLAIAIPTFLGAKNKANAKAAQSNLRNALTAEKTYYVDNQSYTATVTSLQAIENNINWLSATPTSSTANGVYATVDSSGNLTLLAMGKDNNCYAILDTGSATSYGSGAVTSAGACPTITPAASHF